MFLSFLGWYWEGSGSSAPPVVGNNVIRLLRAKRLEWQDEREREDAEFYAKLAEDLPAPVERVVEKVARKAEGESLSAKRARAALRDELASLEVAREDRKHAEALLIVYRRLVIELEAQAVREAELAALALVRKRRIAALLLAAAS